MDRRYRSVAAVLAVTSLAGIAGSVHACGIDGVPSLSANGVLAHPNTVGATATNLATWAPFVFPGTYRAGQRQHFVENVGEVRRTLPAQALTRPWRWTTGDGATVNGYAVTHSYRRAGTYKIVVYAYYREARAWYEYDAALIHVR